MVIISLARNELMSCFSELKPLTTGFTPFSPVRDNKHVAMVTQMLPVTEKPHLVHFKKVFNIKKKTNECVRLKTGI